jgi:hypothetical protein
VCKLHICETEASVCVVFLLCLIPHKNTSNILMRSDCLVTFSLHKETQNRFMQWNEKIIL